MWQSIRSLLFQTPCPLCQKPSQDQFCRDCTGQIFSHCFAPNLPQWQGNFPRFVWGQYEGQLRRALTVMKFEQQPDIGIWLGEQLAQAWLKQPQAKLRIRPQVVPIPLSNRKQAERGFNQAERIAAGFCRLTGYVLRPQALRRVKDTQALFGLGPGDRRRELQSALATGPAFNPHHPWLIVDDIITTGTTALEARRAMEEKGAKVLGIVAIAAPSFSRTMELGQH
ncbi:MULTISPECIES: ComF family protein [unclassified Synechocystis]|uniref:ComF family protein n=1 Tax=unclassified Synechocystis TaxID=2640012 RepID=UPI00048B8B17|nr:MULTISPECIES: ComF family protein [unclassified Synechocystis]AIE74066.1 Competence protein F, phosphoribosyltransferase domain [Synechocystis sp. PCC 6714]MCT0252713.1 ComF family protein [Synechocystis sp. CS-94]